MQFGILGPLDVRQDGEPVAAGGPKQRALLALLLLSANTVVSRDRLIEELWSGQPADTAAHSLDVTVSRLRKVLGGDGDGSARLVTRAPGYLLRVEAEELDLHRFEQLLGAGREARASGAIEDAAARLREAETLWRGRPLADLEFEPVVRVEVDRLAELRMLAVEERIDVELELGKDAALVPELECLVAEHPLRERLRAQLMLALYRSGRQADALQAYRSGRALLVEELGLDPSPRLRELEAAILRHDEALSAPAQAPPIALEAQPTLEAQTSPSQRAAGTRKASTRQPRGSRLSVAAVAGLAAAMLAVLLSTGDDDGDASPLRGHGLALISPRDGRLRATVPLASAPTGIASSRGALWVTHAEAATVTRIDTASRTVRDTINVGRGPTAIAVGAGAVWVVNARDATLSRIDPATDAVTQTLPVGSRPGDVAVADGSVWVADSGDGTVSRIDPATGRLNDTIRTGAGATGLAASGRTLWVSNQGAGTVSRIDARRGSVIQTIDVSDAPSSIAVIGNSVWVLDRLDSTLTRIDAGRDTVEATIPIGGSPGALAAVDGRVWIGNHLGGTVSRVDERRLALVRGAAVGGRPDAFGANRNGLWVGVSAAGVNHRGGTLRVIAHQADADSIDPAIIEASFSGLQLTNDGLVALNHVADVDGTQLVPDLALSLPTPSHGGRSYTFRLRPGIRYSTVNVVMASDVRESFERLFELRSAGAAFYESIEGATACRHRRGRCDLSRGIVVDDRAGMVTFHLTKRDPEFLYKLTLTYAAVLPSGTPSRRSRSPLPATGPYMIRSYVPGKQVLLVRNPRFHQWSRAAQPDGYPRRIVWRFGLGVAHGASAMAAGHGDFMNIFGPLPSDQQRFFQHHPAQLRVNPSPGTGFYFLNTRAPPFDDIRVRRAINYALDRGGIVQKNGGPTAGTTTCQILPSQIPGYRRYCPYTRDPRPDGAWHGADLASAKRLVAESRTTGMRVTVWNTREPTGARVEDHAVIAALHRLGYRARMRLLPDNKYFPLTNDAANHAQIINGGWSVDYPLASSMIGKLTCANAKPPGQLSYDPSGFCDPAIDRQIARATALQAIDPTRANALWAKLDRIITNRAVWLPTTTPSTTDILSARAGNYQYHPAYGALVDQLWVR